MCFMDDAVIYLRSSQMFGNVHATLSDKRIKENIADISTKDMMLVNDIRPISFNYTFDDSKKQRYGFIAQDVQAINPALVSDNSDGLLTVNYIDFIPLLTSKVQQLTSEHALLKNSFDKLVNSVTEQLKSLKDSTEASLKSLKDSTEASLKSLKDSTEANSNAITELKTFVNQQVEGLCNVIDGLQDHQITLDEREQAHFKEIYETIDTFKPTISDAIIMIKDAVDKTLDEHKQRLDQLSTDLKTNIDKLDGDIDDIYSELDDIDKQLETYTPSAKLTELESNFTKQLSDVKVLIETQNKEVKDACAQSNNVEALKKEIDDALEKLTKHVNDTMTTANNTLSDIDNRVIEAYKKFDSIAVADDCRDNKIDEVSGKLNKVLKMFHMW